MRASHDLGNVILQCTCIYLPILTLVVVIQLTGDILAGFYIQIGLKKFTQVHAGEFDYAFYFYHLHTATALELLLNVLSMYLPMTL